MADLKVNQHVVLDGERTWVITRFPTGAYHEYTFANGEKLVGDPQGWMDQGRLVLIEEPYVVPDDELPSSFEDEYDVAFDDDDDEDEDPEGY